jgi:hypothetical protein
MTASGVWIASMSLLVLKGHSQDLRERFEFTIETYAGGGFLLSIRCSGAGGYSVNKAGVWPTVERAQGIAEEIARELLHGAHVIWENSELAA